MAGQRPLLERAAAGDREAFAQLYDTQVDGIYRYLLAWSGDPAAAAALTGEVFSGAFSWLTVTQADTEAAAWLTAMARDAVAQRRGSGASPGAADPVAAVTRLSDPKREVVVLRLLCGHSLDHTAHLSGFTRRAVLELQLSACLTVWELTSGSTAPAPHEPAAEEFEHHLAQEDLGPPDNAPAPPGAHPTLAGALAIAGSLRKAAPGHVVGPDPALVSSACARISSPGHRPPGHRPPGHRPPGHRPPVNPSPRHRPPGNPPATSGHAGASGPVPRAPEPGG